MRPIDWQSISNRLAIDGEARASANPAPRRRRRRPEFAPGNTGAHAGRSEGRRLCRRGQAGRSRELGLRPAGRAEAKAFGKGGRPNARRPRGRTSASVLCGAERAPCPARCALREGGRDAAPPAEIVPALRVRKSFVGSFTAPHHAEPAGPTPTDRMARPLDAADQGAVEVICV